MLQRAPRPLDYLRFIGEEFKSSFWTLDPACKSSPALRMYSHESGFCEGLTTYSAPPKIGFLAFAIISTRWTRSGEGKLIFFTLRLPTRLTCCLQESKHCLTADRFLRTKSLFVRSMRRARLIIVDYTMKSGGSNTCPWRGSLAPWRHDPIRASALRSQWQ